MFECNLKTVQDNLKTSGTIGEEWDPAYLEPTKKILVSDYNCHCDEYYRRVSTHPLSEKNLSCKPVKVLVEIRKV